MLRQLKLRKTQGLGILLLQMLQGPWSEMSCEPEQQLNDQISRIFFEVRRGGAFCQPDVTANLKPNPFKKPLHAHSPKSTKWTKDPPASKHQLCCRVAAETACALGRLSTTNEGLSISTLPTVLSNGVPLVESLEDSVELQLSYRTGLTGWWSLVFVHVHVISFVGGIGTVMFTWY